MEVSGNAEGFGFGLGNLGGEFRTLSAWKEFDIPNWEMISRRRSETFWAPLLVFGNASTHPENMSTKIKTYLTNLSEGMVVKSSYF